MLQNGPPFTAGGRKLHISKCQIVVLRAGDISRESASFQVLISHRICSPDTLELPQAFKQTSLFSAIKGTVAFASFRLLPAVKLREEPGDILRNEWQTLESNFKNQMVPGKSTALNGSESMVRIKDGLTARMPFLDLLMLQAKSEKVRFSYYL